MRFIITFITGLFIATTAQASLKATTQLNMFNDGADPRPEFGLKYYHRTGRYLGFSGWTGYGTKPIAELPDFHYYGGKFEAQFYIKSLTLSPGVSLKFDSNKEFERIPYIKAEWKILD